MTEDKTQNQWPDDLKEAVVFWESLLLKATKPSLAEIATRVLINYATQNIPATQTPEDVQAAVKNAYQFLCSPSHAMIEDNFDFKVSEVIETLIRAAQFKDAVEVEEQEVADVISKSFSSKVSAETCEAAAHNLRVFFPNGLKIVEEKDV